MIFQLINVVLPVFLIIAAGYIVIRLKLMKDTVIDGLMSFALGLAVPCLLFLNVMRLDLSAVFDLRLIITFYAGAISCFTLGILGARLIFRRNAGDAVAISFGAMFSNSLLLGLPIMERAYGTSSLAPNYALLSIHAPLIYLVGITVMEMARADGRGVVGTFSQVLKTMFRNTLMIGLGLGFAVNLSGFDVPDTVVSATQMVANAALPVALFGIGGTLTRYALSSSLGAATMVAILSLIIHPAIAYCLGMYVFELPIGFTRSAVVMASMAPGINAYVFASMYNRGKGAAASAVLLGTIASVFTASAWLWILEHS